MNVESVSRDAVIPAQSQSPFPHLATAGAATQATNLTGQLSSHPSFISTFLTSFFRFYIPYQSGEGYLDCEKKSPLGLDIIKEAVGFVGGALGLMSLLG